MTIKFSKKKSKNLGITIAYFIARHCIGSNPAGNMALFLPICVVQLLVGGWAYWVGEKQGDVYDAGETKPLRG
jgi:hypothetical protein